MLNSQELHQMAAKHKSTVNPISMFQPTQQKQLSGDSLGLAARASVQKSNMFESRSCKILMNENYAKVGRVWINASLY